MAAAAVSLSCPPRRSSRLAHAHAAHNPSPSPLRQPHILKHHRHHRTRIPIHVVDSEPDPDSSSSDPENELTPRALRALKRQRLALDFDGLSISHRGRPKKKRKENIAHADPATAPSSSKEALQPSKRPSSPSPSPLTPKRTFGTDRVPPCENAAHLPSIPECSVDLIDETGHPISISPADEEPSAISCAAPSPCGSSADQSPVSMLTDNANSLLPDTKTGDASSAPSVPPISTDVSITSVPSSPPLGPCAPSSPEPEPLTPLTPLTPSPSPSPSLSGHDRHTSSSPPSPLNESLPLPVPVESAPLPSNPLPPPSSHPPLSAEDCTSSQPTLLSPHPSHLSLHPPLDNLIPFDSLPSNFDSGVPLHLDAHHDNLHEDPHPQPHVPQLPGHFPNPQPDQVQPPQVQYVRPPFTQVPGRDREVNIWKLACQERVESLFRRYGVETIKAIIASEAGSAIVNGAPHESPNLMPNSFPEPPTQGNSAHVTQPPQTRFRLYTPASYTWSSRTVLGSGSSPGKRSSNDNPQGTEVEREAMWMESDLDVDVEMDIDVDMDDDDEDYEDEDEIGELEGDADAESRAKLDLEEANGRGSAAVQPLREGLQAMDVKGEAMMMDVDYTGQSQRACVDLADKENNASTNAAQSPSLFATSDESSMAASTGLPTMPLPSTGLALPLRHQFPPLSSLHVPLLSEPPRAFMGRGTPPDRRRLMEWSVSGRYPGCQTQAFGVGLFVSPTRNPGMDTLPVSMHSTDDIHQGAPDGEDDRPQPHQHAGEWTSFLYAMLEGDGISSCQVDGNVSSDVCRGSSNPGNMNVSTVTATGSTTDMTGWYELGLPSMHMGDVASGVTADMSLSHHPHATHVPAMEQPGDEANSSTLRFALG